MMFRTVRRRIVELNGIPALILLLQFISVLFQVLSDILNLPSFPTRRSSDLITAYLFPENHCALVRNLTLQQHLIRTSRSEEHTSELQSRGHLVCRLLLEKKKILPRAT